MEANIILAKLFQTYEVELAPGQASEPDPIVEITLANRGGVHLQLQKHTLGGPRGQLLVMDFTI